MAGGGEARDRRRALRTLVTPLVLVVMLLGCGDGAEPGPPATASTPVRPGPEPTEGERRERPTAGQPKRPDPEGRRPDREAFELGRIGAVINAYELAINERDGKGVCAAFEPGALDRFRFPAERSSCGASVRASIGYEDPRGFPVFESLTILENFVADLDGEAARVTVPTVTEFADRTEASIEDDVMYLRRTGGRWLLRKPSISLYRAVGIGDPPPAALTPP